MTKGASDGLPPLRDVIAAHGLRADKKFGQNFILDLNLTRRIARAALPLDDTPIIEIGPGPGGLTRGLLMEGARKIIAIEADRRFLPALQEIGSAYPGRLDIINADAMSLSPSQLAGGKFKIISNLPYNIGTALLTKWLDEAWQGDNWQPQFQSLTLMYQKEVAQRLVAAPSTPAYGRLSVLAGWLNEARILFEVDRNVFVPPPKVTSAIVHLVPRPSPLAEAHPDSLQKITAAAFGQRRKMLRASLKQICSDPQQLLLAAGIDPQQRAEALEIEAFCTLARLWAVQNGRG